LGFFCSAVCEVLPAVVVADNLSLMQSIKEKERDSFHRQSRERFERELEREREEVVHHFKIELELEPSVLPPFKQGLGSLVGTYTQFEFQKYNGACTLDVKFQC